MEIEQLLSAKERRQLQKLKTATAAIIALLASLTFWAGTYFLKENIFRHYFNPTRHIIVDQDPLTGEVYAWKDALNYVYTPEDRDVKLFPYGVAGLVLAEMLIGLSAYKLLTEHYVMMLMFKRRFLPYLTEERISPLKVSNL
ncbi:MAG: hypothetical protein C4589_07055 [Peptococcaceae bacterium]|nr:MAG: hypothetical protein C4589_07055 [Peptococcaceae bacterium]